MVSTLNPLRVAAIVGACILAGCSSESSPSSSSQESIPIADATTTTAGPAAPSAPADTAAPISPADATAEARVQAALATLPADWAGTIASDLGDEGDSGGDIVFAACLAPGDYNLDNLDADSAASWELDAEGPPTGSPVGGQQATLEARVFADGVDVDGAYAVLEKVLGTDDGRACLAREVPGQLAAEAPEGTEFDARVEGTTIAGADVGARLVVGFVSGEVTGEFFVDLVAARPDEQGTIFATFVSFGVPVDQAVASAMLVAAIAA